MAPAREVSGIAYISPGVNTAATSRCQHVGNRNTEIREAGRRPAFLSVSCLMETGAFFTEQDVARGFFAVLGAVARDELFGTGTDPTGAT